MIAGFTQRKRRHMAHAFPEVSIHEGALTLRPFTSKDVEATHAGCSDELTQQWLPLPQPYTLDHATNWCTKVSHALRESGDGIHFAITDARTDDLLGTVGLKKTDWGARISEVGYWVAPWARGRGVATEATRAVGRWLLADQGFERMELKAAVDNVASQKVAERAGLHREGIMRNAGLIHAGRVDVILFSLVPRDLGAPQR
ncbi:MULTISPECIES: GNAT family N-acetyltransferase [unclassified Micromonospora]|uniref:GNAT family N-acetyltransferase n=1 Tax=unclassified Micromonospora TaxID=2617518 RepID=UPI00333462E2